MTLFISIYDNHMDDKVPVWGGGLLAVRAIELLQICSQLLQCKHRTQPKHGANDFKLHVWRSSGSIAGLDLPCDILTYFGVPNSRASQEFGSLLQNRTEPHRKTSREAGLRVMYRLLWRHRIQGQLEQYLGLCCANFWGCS